MFKLNKLILLRLFLYGIGGVWAASMVVGLSTDPRSGIGKVAAVAALGAGVLVGTYCVFFLAFGVSRLLKQHSSGDSS